MRGGRRLLFISYLILPFLTTHRGAPGSLSPQVGPAEAVESYLHFDRLFEAVEATGVDAIHPGYGFLAENHLFAAECERRGITFISEGDEVKEGSPLVIVETIKIETPGLVCPGVNRFGRARRYRRTQ